MIEQLLQNRHSGAIHLAVPEYECRVCERLFAADAETPTFGIPTYEAEILHDNDPGDWGGQPVCLRCYCVVRGLQELITARIPVSFVAELVRRPATGEGQ